MSHMGGPTIILLEDAFYTYMGIATEVHGKSSCRQTEPGGLITKLHVCITPPFPSSGITVPGRAEQFNT